MAIKQLLVDDNKVIQTLARWAQRREDIQKHLFDTIGMPPVTRSTRSIQIINEERLDEYVRSKISYCVGEGEKITAYLLHSEDLMKPAPAILALHQTVSSGKDEVVGLDGYPDFAYGHELAMRGYVVLAPDHLTAGERVYPGKESFDSGPFYEHYTHWSMVGKNLEDSKSAIDVLCALDYVDKDRIGVIGHSHGGHNAIFVAALDDRVKVTVSNCGLSVFSEEEERMEWSLEEGYIYIPQLRRYFLENIDPPFDLHEVAALIAPRPWLNISAYFDEAYGNQEFLAEVGTQLYQVYSLYQASRAFGYYMHGNDHSFPKSARTLAYEWLDQWLKNK
ncbi:MAG: dienelactone hydrolase family protein [Anaerolineae bacterium]|nr:dienelactone hydrolase family protein [Anaerolineae bacterium]